MVAYSQKNYASALAALKKVTQAAPQFAPAFTGIGLTCEAQKDLQCALTAYKTATGLDPNDFTASQGLQRVQAGMQK